MYRWVLSSVVALSFLALSVTGSWALEVSYLNENFERVKGKPLPQQVEFQASAGLGKLLLVNGGQNGSYRVSAATIALNGSVIVEPNAMNQNVADLEVDVSLEEQNVLVVELVSMPESYIDIAVIQEVQADAAGFVGVEEKTIEVQDPDSPLIGVSLGIPSGALLEPVLISVVSPETPPEAPSRGSFAGEVIELKPEGLKFETPITLTVPYNDSNNDGVVDGNSIDEQFVSVGYLNEETHRWEQVKIVDRDPLNNTVTAEIEHFSIYSPFVRVDNIIPQTTQLPPANIEIDGNPVEWSGNDVNGKPILPIMSESDPSGDSICDLEIDFKDVYTAMDESFVYIMIKMAEPIDEYPDIRLYVDTRLGKDHVSDSYADLSLSLGSYGIYFFNHSGDIGGDYATVIENNQEGVKVVIGDVLEAKIPLTMFRSSTTNLLPSYFNATRVIVRDSNNPNVICDLDEMYAKIPWFKFQKRLYPDKVDRITFIFEKITRQGAFLTDFSNLSSVVITRPDGSSINLNIDELKAGTQKGAWGFFNWNAKTFLYDPYILETYFYKHYFKQENNTYEEEIQIGDYLLEVIDINGDIFEDKFIVTTTEDIPAVDSETVQCHIHQNNDGLEESLLFKDMVTNNNISLDNGDLYCDWEYPDYIGNPDFADVFEKIQAHPHIRAYKGETMVKYIYPSVVNQATDFLGDFVIVPAADLDELLHEGNVTADRLTISIRTRLKSGSVRSYSSEKEVDISTLP